MMIKALRKDGLKYFENDYTAYESHFTQEIMQSIELQLYRHCLVAYPTLADQICKTIGGDNKLHTKAGVKLTLKARRMSGDMCTSLGNGFTNLMIALFIAQEAGGHLDGFVEGDDGLFATDFEMTTQQFEALGFTVKIKKVSDPCRAHFCGMTMTDDGIILKDPRRVFQNFGWTHSCIHAGNYVMDQLLRSKALSLAYELPNCPIVGVLSRVALELTHDLSRREEQGKYRVTPEDFELSDFNPTPQSRQLMSELFDISIPTQLAAEAAIKNHDLDLVSSLIPPLISDMLMPGCQGSAVPNLDYSVKYIEAG